MVSDLSHTTDAAGEAIRAVTPRPHDSSHGKIEASAEPDGQALAAGWAPSISETAKPSSASFPDVPFPGAQADRARPTCTAGGRGGARGPNRPGRRPRNRLARDRGSAWRDQTGCPPALPAPPP